MKRKTLKNIVSILRESPIYGMLSRSEKRSLIRGLTEYHAFLGDSAAEEIVGYESALAVAHNSVDDTSLSP